MWKLIPRPLRRWLLLAVALPLFAWLLDQAAEQIAQRRGETRTTKLMREPRRWVGRDQTT
jgi:hypothetical protein